MSQKCPAASQSRIVESLYYFWQDPMGAISSIGSFFGSHSRQLNNTLEIPFLRRLEAWTQTLQPYNEHYSIPGSTWVSSSYHRGGGRRRALWPSARPCTAWLGKHRICRRPGSPSPSGPGLHAPPTRPGQTKANSCPECLVGKKIRINHLKLRGFTTVCHPSMVFF